MNIQWNKLFVLALHAAAGYCLKHAIVHAATAHYAYAAVMAAVGWFIHNPPPPEATQDMDALKKFTTVTKLLVLSSFLVLFTQTRATAQSSSLLPGGLGQLAGDAGNFLTDAQPYFGTNGDMYAGGGVIKCGNKYGALVDVNLWSLVNSNQVSIGFTGGWLNGQWYDGSITLKAGTTWTTPLGKFYTQIISGPGYNFNQHHVVALNFVVVHRLFTIGKWIVDPFIGVGNISDQSGPAYIGGVNVRPPKS